MTEENLKKIQTYVNRYYPKRYTDRVDKSIFESLSVYGFIRNPKTEQVRFIRIYLDLQGNEQIHIVEDSMSLDDVKDTLDLYEDGDHFFSYIGETKEEVLNTLDNSHLANIIYSLQSYNGSMFY